MVVKPTKKSPFPYLPWTIISVLMLLSIVASFFLNINTKWQERNSAIFSAAVVKKVSAAQIYPEFSCPCCGQPLNKEAPCCNAMTQMINFIDEKVENGLSEEEVILATAKKFGIDRLIKPEKQKKLKDILATRAPADAPRIQFDNESFDLGKVSQSNGEVFVDFKFRNGGKTNLVIDKLSSSCGCTSASVIYNNTEGPRFTMEGHGKGNPKDWQVSIAPGNTATVRVYYDPNVHKDLTGAVTRTVSVFSNDPVEFEKKLTIKLKQIP